MKTKRKQKTIAQLVDKAAVLMQLYVRMKASDENGCVRCVTCGTERHYKDRMQGGHFISRVSVATKLMEENIHPQCNQCNGYLRGNIVPYTLYMIDFYGRDFVDELEGKKFTPKKYYKDEVEKIISGIRLKIKELDQ